MRYEDYEWIEDDNGILYLTAAPDAKPHFTDPIDDFEQIVLDAVNTGLTCLSSKADRKQRMNDILAFVKKYGLLGLMTAIPRYVEFLDGDFTYFPINPFIKDEKMPSGEYLKIFFPLGAPYYYKDGNKLSWDIEPDTDMRALAMTMMDREITVIMSMQRTYAERYEWVEQQFKNWAFIVCASQEYYSYFDEISDKERLLYKQSVRAFEGVAPTYRMELYDKPTLVWEFNSLMQPLQIMINLMLSDENNPVRVCENCGKAFIAKNTTDKYCSSSCEQHKKSGAIDA